MNSMRSVALVVCLAAVAYGQARFQCPAEDGFYQDPQQCDKYYDCYRGEMTEKLCPDGLVFDSTSIPTKLESCNYPFIVSCDEGMVQQAARPAGIQCPRQNGYFEHEDPTNCQDYYECVNGIYVVRNCADGLVFDEFTGACQWERAGFRTGCLEQIVVLPDGFSCPNITQSFDAGPALDHPLFPHPEDCRAFYVCQEGKYPRLSGCPQGTVFNDINLTCDDPLNVPGCENYYPDAPQQSGSRGGIN